MPTTRISRLHSLSAERAERAVTDKDDQSSPKRDVPRISLTPGRRSPGKLLHDAHLRLSTSFVGALGQAGYQLPIDAWAVLNLLWEEDNLPQSEIGARIGRDRHQTSRLIDCLDQQRLVTRESISEDRRIKRVVLTHTGREAQTTLGRVAIEFLEGTFAGVAQEDYDGFIRCLQHIVDRLKPTTGKEE